MNNIKPTINPKPLKAKSRTYKIMLVVISTILIFSAYLCFRFLFINKAANTDAAVKPEKGAVVETAKPVKIVKIYSAQKDFKVGDTITVNDIKPVELPETDVPANAVRSAATFSSNGQAGKIVIDKITINEFIVSDDIMDSYNWYEDTDRLVEFTFDSDRNAIPESVDKGSIIDITLVLEAVPDEIVVSKAVVAKKKENTLAFFLNQLEREYLREASMEGKLYVSTYYDYGQLSSTVDYNPDYKSKQRAKQLKEEQLSQTFVQPNPIPIPQN